MSFLRDQLFKKKPRSIFNFNEKTTAHFQDMLYRSIPGYTQLQQLIVSCCVELLKPKQLLVDMGCSNANTLLLLRKKIRLDEVALLGIDISPSMCKLANKRLSKQLNSTIPYTILCQSISDPYKHPFNTGIIISSLTLHFLNREKRLETLRLWRNKLYKNSGHLILVEKTFHSQQPYKHLFNLAHNQFRKQNNYLNQEILNKTQSLKGVLNPLSSSDVKSQVIEAGFSECHNLWQWGDFYAWIIKS